MQATETLALANEVFKIEADAIANLSQQVSKDFHQVIEAIVQCKGRIVVTGMGKSGHIAGKIAATLASTGSPAFFVHPGEASHGDLGMITTDDIVIAISNSGETNEVLELLPMLKRFGITLIAMTGNPESNLAKNADFHLNIAVEKEACPLGLAPTSSTTATLVMGDAIAVCALKLRGFTEQDFALSHPGGTLGKRLLIKVKDLMHETEEVPIVDLSQTIGEALDIMSSKGFGITSVVNENNSMIGVFTDGDIRRSFGNSQHTLETSISEVMTKGGKNIGADSLASEALRIMEQHKITSLFIVDDKLCPYGIIHLHDILKAGVV